MIQKSHINQPEKQTSREIGRLALGGREGGEDGHTHTATTFALVFFFHTATPDLFYQKDSDLSKIEYFFCFVIQDFSEIQMAVDS